jgi:PelA/Pel-15E family pectate lyase
MAPKPLRAEYPLPPVANAKPTTTTTEPTKKVAENSAKKATDIEIADRMLIAQRSIGGWSKTIDGKTQPPQYDKEWTSLFEASVKDEVGRNDATIDNHATNREILHLAKVYNTSQNEKYKEAAERGIAYLLKMQYKNGGFPQFYPDSSGYRKHITFNDDAMINCLKTLKAIAESKTPFEKIGDKYRKDAKKAVDCAVDVILKTQIVSRGRLTIWCAQHHYKTLQPVKARAYELPSFSGNESVKIVEFLMSLNKPTPSVKKAITSAVAFFDSIKITGLKVERIKDASQPSGQDMVVKADATAPTTWARFYDLDTHKPYFCGRDGTKKASLAEIENERRVGYGWYGTWPADLLEKEFPKWQAKWK